MSTSKHIDVICIAVISIIFINTLLFMLGEKFELLRFHTKEDNIENILFTDNDLMDNWDTTGATEIKLNGDSAEIKGTGAYFSNNTLNLVYAGKYIINGTLSGSIQINADANDKIWLLLDEVDICSNTAAPIYIKQADKVFITLKENSQNNLSFSSNDETLDIDGCIFSHDDLTINGKGSLTVNSDSFHGIVCNDSLVFTGGTININAKKDAVHAHDAIKICNTFLTVSAGDDGLHAGNDDESSIFYLESGNINISECYEGIEANDITITGGTITITPTDDGINASGNGLSSNISVSGGDISIINSSGRDADGLDSNGSIIITGGSIFISVSGNGTNCAIDYGSENKGIFTISGGTVIACGSSLMAEGPDSSSTQGFIMENISENAGNSLSILNENGEIILMKEIPNAFSSVLISSPELAIGDTVQLKTENTEKEITVSNIAEKGMENIGIKGNFNQKRENNPENENPFTKEGKNIPSEFSDNSKENFFFTQNSETNIPPDIPNENSPGEIPRPDNKEIERNKKNSLEPPVNDNSQQINNFKENRQKSFQNNRMNNIENKMENPSEQKTTISNSTWILLGTSIIVLIGGIMITIRKKY